MSSANWWARKLGAPTPPPTPSAAASVAPAAPVVPTAAGRGPSGHASHERSSGICPECGSDYYFATRSDDIRLSATPPAARCFDCGYPVRHSTSGMGGIGDGGAVAASKQTGPGNNFNPGHIIGRIG